MALKLQHLEGVFEAGLDEAGRGCLAGPVVAAAVILPADFENEFINDSKKLGAAKRETLREVIMENALAWAVGIVSPARIDEINILNASFEAMHIAIGKLGLQPEHLLIDGNRFKKHSIPHTCIVKGDGKYLNIAAASILAKTERDAIMLGLHSQFSKYGWDSNKGYPTAFHREAIRLYGVTVQHRRSFNLYAPLTLF